MWNWHDTIVALASAPGSAPRAVVRLAGPHSRPSLDAIFLPHDEAAWQATRSPRRHAGRLRLAGWSSLAPVEVDFWPDARCYCGQPTAELHFVGAAPLVDAVVVALCRHGARQARPGEFTLRAFLNGKIDLLQAEAVLGVIDADDSHELTEALAQLGGGLSQPLVAARNDLLDLLADLEAGLDFVEERIEFVSRDDVLRRVTDQLTTFGRLRRQADDRSTANERPRVVLAGLPNAGKSSLFNALLGRDAAIASPIAGATRDSVTAVWRCKGRDVDLIDSAGWEGSPPHEEGDLSIASAAQAERRRQLERADVVVWCESPQLDDVQLARNAAWRLEAAQFASVVETSTMCDVIDERPHSNELPKSSAIASSIRTSASCRFGIVELEERIAELLDDARRRGWLGRSTARFQECLARAIDSLQAVEPAIRHASGGMELAAVELRLAIESLGEIVGAVHTDDLLDRIFSKFCIGK